MFLGDLMYTLKKVFRCFEISIDRCFEGVGFFWFQVSFRGSVFFCRGKRMWRCWFIELLEDIRGNQFFQGVEQSFQFGFFFFVVLEFRFILGLFCFKVYVMFFSGRSVFLWLYGGRGYQVVRLSLDYTVVFVLCIFEKVVDLFQVFLRYRFIRSVFQGSCVEGRRGVERVLKFTWRILFFLFFSC